MIPVDRKRLCAGARRALARREAARVAYNASRHSAHVKRIATVRAALAALPDVAAWATYETKCDAARAALEAVYAASEVAAYTSSWRWG